MTDIFSRASGALYGLAIGDALGMPTQSFSRADIVTRYGPLLTGFEPAPPDQPLAAGMPAGSVTDDTEQAMLLAQLLIEGDGWVDAMELARRLAAWEKSMRARGSLDLLGPSTRRAIQELLDGADTDQSGRTGTTNGAAMRIAPVGIANEGSNPGNLVSQVVEASRPTHNTGVALAGAAAVAAAVSAGIAGADVPQAIEQAEAAARIGGQHGHWIAAADVAARIRWATRLVAGRSPEEAGELIYTLVGTSLATQESVPAAFAVLATRPDAPWDACLLAASLGGDCDTIAAITGAIAGACHGADAFPAEARGVIQRVNGLPIDETAAALLKIRLRHGGGAPPEPAGRDEAGAAR